MSMTRSERQLSKLTGLRSHRCDLNSTGGTNATYNTQDTVENNPLTAADPYVSNNMDKAQTMQF